MEANLSVIWSKSGGIDIKPKDIATNRMPEPSIRYDSKEGIINVEKYEPKPSTSAFEPNNNLLLTTDLKIKKELVNNDYYTARTSFENPILINDDLIKNEPRSAGYSTTIKQLKTEPYSSFNFDNKPSYFDLTRDDEGFGFNWKSNTSSTQSTSVGTNVQYQQPSTSVVNTNTSIQKVDTNNNNNSCSSKNSNLGSCNKASNAGSGGKDNVKIKKNDVGIDAQQVSLTQKMENKPKIEPSSVEKGKKSNNNQNRGKGKATKRPAANSSSNAPTSPNSKKVCTAEHMNQQNINKAKAKPISTQTTSVQTELLNTSVKVTPKKEKKKESMSQGTSCNIGWSRPKITQSRVDQLTAEYIINPNPDVSTIRQYASQIGMFPTQVFKWFHDQQRLERNQRNYNYSHY